MSNQHAPSACLRVTSRRGLKEGQRYLIAYTLPCDPPAISFPHLPSTIQRFVKMETFQNIHYDLSKSAGRLRVADSGMGWKGNKSENPLTLESGSFNNAQWSKGARGYEVKIFSRSQGVIYLDGFQEEVQFRSNSLCFAAHSCRISIACPSV